MNILSKTTDFVIKVFNIRTHEGSYKHLLLVISLLITIVGFLGFAIKAYTTHSINLFYVLTIASILNIGNIILIKLKSTFTFSSYFYIAIFLLAMAFLVFDSGRSGYGYLWFYIIPVVSVSVLGVKKGTIASLMFFVYLLIMFFLPDYYLNDEYFSELKPRLLISFFALVLLILYKEWTVELFKKQIQEEDTVNKNNSDYRNAVIDKFSNQIRFIADDIQASVDTVRSKMLKPQLQTTINKIQESSTNLLSIINGFEELSNLKISENRNQGAYSLRVELERIKELFSSYKVEISFEIDKEIPLKMSGNLLLVKQILYYIIESYVRNTVNRVHVVILKGVESSSFIEINYQVVNILTDKQTYKLHKQNCKQIDLLSVEGNEKEIETLGLSEILPFVENLNGKVNIQKTAYFVSVCFNQKIKKNKKYYRKIEEGDIINKVAIDESINDKKLNKMRVLLMEDNPIAQKSILFALDKLVKYLDIAENGKEGLEMFHKNKYDLILLDMNMPILDGYEVAKKIRSIELGSKFHIPIIATISSYLLKDTEAVLASGVDDILKKPLQANDLIKKINELS